MLTESRSTKLDELVLDALTELTQNAPPSAVGTDSYFKIEVIREEELDLDIAVTGRFLRWSMPYERVDLDAALDSPAFVQPAETVAFDKQWFDDADDAVAAIAETEELAPRRGGWTWLAISVAVAGLAVALAEYLL
ncbi:MAG TPA: hypothetical protein VIV58_22240 [Kofleriaceae bacterium]